MIREAFVLMKRLGISVIVLLMLPVLAVIAKPGQSERFEVASVKPSIAGLAPTIGILPGGRFAAFSVTLRRLIRWAYRVQDSQISGGPDGSGQTPYDVMAKTEGVADDQEIHRMVQSLLEDQFKLKIHTESKAVLVYSITILNSGTKLKPTERGREEPSRISRKPCGIELSFGNGATLDQFANFLSSQSWMDRPVVNRTGLEGMFDLKLEFSPDGPISLVDQGFESGVPPPPPPPDVPCSGTSLFDAVQRQLGLRLLSEKAPIENIVIDHWEKPQN